MTIHQRQPRKVLSPKEATEALLAKRAAPASVAPRVLEDAAKADALAPRRRTLSKAQTANVVAHPSSFGAAYGDASFRRTSTEKMLFQDWDKVPSNPRQRNEQVRIDKGKAEHLMRPNEKHREVAMAELPDGRRLKVDGHTRSAIWRRGMVAPPSYVIVDIYSCTSEQAAMDLYDMFDSSPATEDGTDRVTGAFREADISPKCAMLHEGGISTAMRELYEFVYQVNVTKSMKSEAINGAVKLFAKEIMLLDKIQPTRDAFPYGIVMGAILTFARHGDKALRFWELYAADGGAKMEGIVDAVEALRIRRNDCRGKGNAAMGRLLMNYAIKGFESYLKAKSFNSKSPYNPMHKDKLRKYADDVRKLKGTK